MNYFFEQFFKGLPIKSLLHYASSSIICQGLRLAGVLLTTHLISLQEFGLFAQIMTCIALCGVVSGIGHHDALIAYQGEDRRYYRFHFQTSLFTFIISLLLLFWVAPMILGRESVVLRYSVIIAGIIFLESISPFFLMSAQKRFRFKFTGVIDVLSVGSWFLFIVIGTYFSKTVEILLWAKMIEGTVRLLLLLTQVKWEEIGFCFDRDVFDYYRQTYFKNAPLRAIVDTLIQRVDILILSHYTSAIELGLYERIQHFIQISISISVSLIDRVSLMTFSKFKDEPYNLSQSLKSSIRFVCLSSGASTLLLTILIPLVSSHIFEPQNIKPFFILWLCSIGTSFFKPIAMTFNFFYLGLGKSYLLLFQNLLFMLTLVLILAALVPTRGIYGASSAISFSHLLLVVYQWKKKY